MQITPDDVNHAAWIGVAASVGTAVALTSLAFLLHVGLVRTTRMRIVATTISAIISLFIVFAASMVMISVTSKLVNGRVSESNGFYFVTHVWIDPGPLQKIVPLAAMLATWLLAFTVRHTLANRRLSNSG